VIEKSRKKTFNYTGAVMTLPTGVLAIAEARYGNSNEALEYLKRLGHTFSHTLPGSMYEVSPDFGMMAQAWNIYAVEIPVISHFFGITPEAGNREITFQPAFPSQWTTAAIQNLVVGQNHISIAMDALHGKDREVTYTIEQTLPDWTVVLALKKAKLVSVNNENSRQAPGINNTIRLTGKNKFVVTIRKVK
jgi:hypothetical protein